MPFEIIANKLERDSEIKSLKLENEEYAVTIFYYGDYAEDRKNGSCDVSNLSMSCKPKGEGIPLCLMSGNVMLSIPSISALPIYETDVFKVQLDRAKESALELQDIIEKYFGIDSEW